jgi:predicted transcriptional regulator
MSHTKEELEEMIAEMIPLIAQHKADGKNSTAETCEKIKKVYENELHYVLTGEKIEMPWEEWADID